MNCTNKQQETAECEKRGCQFCYYDEEIWKDIEGYEGIYQISNYGRVKSLGRYKKNHSKMQLLKERILKPQINASGYWTIGLFKNGKRKLCRVHRLVGKAFIPNPYNKPEINHKDGNKLNNHKDNLEWVTTSENVQHAWDMNLHVVTEKLRQVGKKHSKLYFIHEGQRKRIIQYDLDENFIKEWKSIKNASEKLKIQPKSISECCKGKRKSAGGYVWEYAN